MTIWQSGIKEKGNQLFNFAEFYEKEATKASKELHKIVDSSDLMMYSRQRVQKGDVFWCFNLILSSYCNQIQPLPDSSSTLYPVWALPSLFFLHT